MNNENNGNNDPDHIEVEDGPAGVNVNINVNENIHGDVEGQGGEGVGENVVPDPPEDAEDGAAGVGAGAGNPGNNNEGNQGAQGAQANAEAQANAGGQAGAGNPPPNIPPVMPCQPGVIPEADFYDMIPKTPAQVDVYKPVKRNEKPLGNYSFTLGRGQNQIIVDDELTYTQAKVYETLAGIDSDQPHDVQNRRRWDNFPVDRTYSIFSQAVGKEVDRKLREKAVHTFVDKIEEPIYGENTSIANTERDMKHALGGARMTYTSEEVNDIPLSTLMEAVKNTTEKNGLNRHAMMQLLLRHLRGDPRSYVHTNWERARVPSSTIWSNLQNFAMIPITYNEAIEKLKRIVAEVPHNLMTTFTKIQTICYQIDATEAQERRLPAACRLCQEYIFKVIRRHYGVGLETQIKRDADHARLCTPPSGDVLRDQGREVNDLIEMSVNALQNQEMVRQTGKTFNIQSPESNDNSEVGEVAVVENRPAGSGRKSGKKGKGNGNVAAVVTTGTSNNPVNPPLPQEVAVIQQQPQQYVAQIQPQAQMVQPQPNFPLVSYANFQPPPQQQLPQQYPPQNDQRQQYRGQYGSRGGRTWANDGRQGWANNQRQQQGGNQQQPRSNWNNQPRRNWNNNSGQQQQQPQQQQQNAPSNIQLCHLCNSTGSRNTNSPMYHITWRKCPFYPNDKPNRARKCQYCGGEHSSPCTKPLPRGGRGQGNPQQQDQRRGNQQDEVGRVQTIGSVRRSYISSNPQDF